MAVLSFLTYLRGIYKLDLHNSSRVHNAVIQSIYDCFVMAREDIDLARLEMCLSTATGYWLDCWGEYFNVYRKSGEQDREYSKRIIDSVISPKCTIPAIKDHVVDYLNSKYHKEYTREDVLIREPWKDIAKYSHKGALSRDARFFSGDYYCHAVLDISIPEEVESGVVDLVNAVKAAGVKVIWSILNSYDIVSGFNSADDAWASYLRHIQMQTQRNQYTGLVLSNSSPNPVLSGSREIWSITTSLYQWYAKVLDKDTDKSIIITKKDLIGIIDYYKVVEETLETDPTKSLRPSDDGTMSVGKVMSGAQAEVKRTEHLVGVGDDVLKSLEILDKFLTLSYQGRMSTSEGVMFNYTTSHKLYSQLAQMIAKFKEEHPDYYNALQPPILNGERAMWLVTRNKNWLWNTPTMSHDDFYKLWEPYEGYEEHTINSIIEFEDAYYQGYLTFGDQYQPPIVVGKPFRWTPKIHKEWMFNSVVFENTDLEQLYTRQFYPMGMVENNDPLVREIEEFEENYSEWGYSTVGDEQPPILLKTRKSARCESIFLQDVQFQVTENEIGKSFKLQYTTSPSNTTDYVKFSSSNEEVASISDEGIVTYKGVGLCTLGVVCGDKSASAQIIVTEIVKPVPPTPPEPEKKIILLENFIPNGEKFTAYDDEFDITKQTIYAEISLDNMTKSLQDVLSIGYGDKVVSFRYPKIENIKATREVIDTSDNLKLSDSKLNSNDGLISGSKYETEEYYVKHESDIEQVIHIDTSDNMFLSNGKMSSKSNLMSGSPYDIEEVETILVPAFIANIGVNGVTTTVQLPDNNIRIAMGQHGYYINGVQINNSKLSQVINAIKAAKSVQIGSLLDGNRSYATYAEISILNTCLSREELSEVTS